MNKRQIVFLLSLFFYFHVEAQKLISGPWAGNVELRSATIWAEVTPGVKTITLVYSPANDIRQRKSVRIDRKAFPENIIKIELPNLDINTTYTYSVLLDGAPVKTDYPTRFTTKDLWQYRKPAPDFNFLTGSCAYFNEPAYDRPGKPYGLDSSIFNAMGNTPAAFHLWLGDAWYTREVDYNSVSGIKYRVQRDRSTKVIQKFLAAMPQYFIWDDHDYGPNNAGKSFILKDESRIIFRDYTLNPSYGENGKGIYTKISYSDVDLFLTDDRFFRSEAKYPDSINGRPDPAKTYFGRDQMEWLKNALLYSTATFKVIATGGQVLNPVSTSECMRFYSYEYNELLDFIKTTNLKGVLFLTGDRHHSEVIKLLRPGTYPLYDITVSPLTATVSKARNAEVNNPARISGTLIEAQNFGNISVSGKKNERILSVFFIGISGNKLGEWSVSEKELN